MIPLMELLMQGGNGAALDVIARQMGISRAEAERAAEALMPAFSQGLKRNVSDPAGFMRFMAALASGGHQDYFDQPSRAAGKGGVKDGEAILGDLFGSKEVSRAIAAQAAHATGLSQEMMKQMLPMLAPILMGGMFRQMTGQAAQASAAANPLGRILEQMMGGGSGYRGGGGGFGGGAGNPWGQILEEMMRGGQPGGGRLPQGADDPFGRILEEMLGGGRRTGRTGNPGSRDTFGQEADNPLGTIFEEMLRGRQGEPHAPRQERYEEPEPEPKPRYRPDMDRETDYRRQEDEEPRYRREPEPEPEPAARKKSYRPPDDGEPQPSTKGGLEDLFGEMFETGRATQREYQRGVEQIFEQFFGGGKTGR